MPTLGLNRKLAWQLLLWDLGEPWAVMEDVWPPCLKGHVQGPSGQVTWPGEGPETTCPAIPAEPGLLAVQAQTPDS